MKKTTKTINQEIVKESKDFKTGEIITEVSSKVFTVQREPDYVKLYVQDLSKLKGLTKGTNSILLSLVKRLPYNNELVLVASVKRAIMKETLMSMETVNKALKALVAKDVLIRKDRGLYLMNPNLFARGSWEDIKKIRLSIEYGEGETKSIKAEFIDA